MLRSSAVQVFFMFSFCAVHPRHEPSSSSQARVPRLGTRALAFVKRSNKRLKRSCDEDRGNWSETQLPPELTKLDDSYSSLDHMLSTPMADVMLKSLRKKGADVRFMCQEVCGAAVLEGSTNFHTRLLSSIKDERVLHSKLRSQLPDVTKLKLPVSVKKRPIERDFSASSAIADRIYIYIWVQRHVQCAGATRKTRVFTINHDVNYCALTQASFAPVPGSDGLRSDRNC